MKKYSRILLKLSGESLAGDKEQGIDEKRLEEYARQLKEVAQSGVEIGIVIGGGNILEDLVALKKDLIA
jgi:uridylate kinase